jgi:hypothetical protein
MPVLIMSAWEAGIFYFIGYRLILIIKPQWRPRIISESVLEKTASFINVFLELSKPFIVAKTFLYSCLSLTIATVPLAIVLWMLRHVEIRAAHIMWICLLVSFSSSLMLNYYLIAKHERLSFLGRIHQLVVNDRLMLWVTVLLPLLNAVSYGANILAFFVLRDYDPSLPIGPPTW